jgi:RNA ligase (TIGR02306 family)
MRSLASVKRITKINPIDGADAIECAIVGGGWPVVIRKGEFAEGDLAIYLEIDSFVPTALAPFLSRGKEPREFNGCKGERLRTIKLRGQISQGLLLKNLDDKPEGEDLTEWLGVQKWDKPIPAQLQGQMKGNFPSWIRKTDQERVQNLDGKICWDDEFEVTIKLDGSSMTIWFNEGEVGVCSRNVDLKMDQDGNSFVDMAKSVIGNMTFPESIAIQGELIGPNIQGNREGLFAHEYYVFDIWDIAKQEYWIPEMVRKFCKCYGLDHAPVLHTGVKLRYLNIESIESCLANSEGASLNHDVREGLVFKRVDGKFSFKAISNKFLLGEA